MKYTRMAVAGLLCIAGMVAESNADGFSNRIYGDGYITGDQIYNGVALNDPQTFFNHRWLQDCQIIFGDSVTKGERVNINVSLRGLLLYSYWIDPTEDIGGWATRFPTWSFQINQASGTYVFGDAATKPLSLTLGFFPYKYNPDVRNLGEYLFRSMAHPNFINATFDEPYQRILGVKLTSLLLDGNLKQDLILSNEWDLNPTQDFSLAYVAGLNIGKLLSIGIGGQASHLFSISNRYTDPTWTKQNITWYIKDEAAAHDSLAIDSTTNPGFNDSTYVPKRSYYSFQAIKLMGRINFTPFEKAPDISLPVVGQLLGPQDLKIYAEANVLGLQNILGYQPDVAKFPVDRTLMQYKANGEYYSKLSERIPVTFGINAPTNPVIAYGIIPLATFLLGQDSLMFYKHTVVTNVVFNTSTNTWDTTKAIQTGQSMARMVGCAGSLALTGAMLCLQDLCDLNVRPDVLNFEFEYWSNRYANSFGSVYAQFAPVPNISSGPIIRHNRWRWSAYASKRMAKYYVNFQVAHDHLIPFSPELNKLETSDVLGAPGLWWWALKTGFYF